MPTKAEKIRFTSTRLGISNVRSIDPKVVLVPTIQRIALALDINFTKLLEPCYSNLSSLTKIATQLLIKNILTKPTSLKFAKVIRLFPFPLDCLYLPLPIRYIGSYTLT